MSTLLFFAIVLAALIVGYSLGWRDAVRSERERRATLLEVARSEVHE